PNSAGGAPEITSNDWIESKGIWFENTLLCWSVMGWPSTENEFSAWSPSPLNRPFESAATPGVENVTRELTDEDALSTGSLSNRARSTSVWKVGSFSTKSPPPSTATVLELPATVRGIFNESGTDERTSMSWASGP